MVPFTSDEIGAIESIIAGIIGNYSEKSNSTKRFLLSYTKSGFLIAHHPVLVNSNFLLHYTTD